MVFFDEESREVDVTSAERRDPMATSAGEEQETARRAEVPASRKRAGERSEERTGTHSSPGSVTVRDLQPGTALPAVDAVEQAGRSEEQTGARAPRDLQSANVLPVASVGGRGDPQGAWVAVWERSSPYRPIGVGVCLQSCAARLPRPRDAGVEHRPDPRAGGLEAHPAACCGERRGQQGGGDGPPGAAADNVTAAATLLAAIPVSMAGVASEVTLAAPPPSAAVEETREGELPTLPGGGLHDLSLSSELKASEGSVGGTELGRPAAFHANEVVEIPSDDEADTVAEPSVSSRELAVVQSEAGPSGGSSEGDLEWPCPEDPSKVRFVLRDSQERQLWDIFGGARVCRGVRAHQAVREA
ncbi:uncharacterized protein [Miscanthus floridulus]|uniref:uncharacterized protein n=1 Tax=Miscanthus floridulus TaxID=154761 RepID=UPI00345A2F7C